MFQSATAKGSNMEPGSDAYSVLETITIAFIVSFVVLYVIILALNFLAPCFIKHNEDGSKQIREVKDVTNAVTNIELSDIGTNINKRVSDRLNALSPKAARGKRNRKSRDSDDLGSGNTRTKSNRKRFSSKDISSVSRSESVSSIQENPLFKYSNYVKDDEKLSF